MNNHVPSRGTIIVEGDVFAIDKLWKNDSDVYINRKLEGGYKDNRELAKYMNSKKDIMEGKVEIPPIMWIRISKQITEIRFTNGRNRFANLRDVGIKTIPIVIEKKQLGDFRKLGLIA